MCFLLLIAAWSHPDHDAGLHARKRDKHALMIPAS
jgi:hypothetical protein